MSRASDGVLFSYSPEGSFTRTIGWLFAALPLIGVVAGFIDLFSGRGLRVVLPTIGISFGLSGGLYLASRAIDRMQESIRVEVLATGVLRFRNLAGRVREIPLRRAQSFEVKDLRGKPRIAPTSGRDTGGRRGHRLFSGDVELRGQSGNRRSPHFTEISVRDPRGKRHSVTLSGAMPQKEVRKLSDAIDAARRDRSEEA